MPGKRRFEQQVAALDLLRQLPSEDGIKTLRKALADRNNFIAGKAADLVREFYSRDPKFAALSADILAAFNRFFDHPLKSDPQCWAKNALSRALAALEYQGPETFLRGLRHIQLEPVWGGTSDSAGTLRATCALALVQCRGLRENELLSHLIELLADKDKAVRVEVVRALEQVGSPSAALLLRLRATLGADEPEVLGACYAGVLRIEGLSAISLGQPLSCLCRRCRGRSCAGHRRHALCSGTSKFCGRLCSAPATHGLGLCCYPPSP